MRIEKKMPLHIILTHKRINAMINYERPAKMFALMYHATLCIKMAESIPWCRKQK